MLTLETDITKINRVGIATAKKLKRIGVETVRDLLFYFPYRYDDFSEVTKIKDLKAGIQTNIVGKVELIRNKRSPRKRMYITEALINDETEQIKIIWFNQPFIARNLRIGDRVSLSGKVEDDYGIFVMKAPVYEKITTSNVHTQGLVPNYHLTANLTQKQIRFLVKQIIKLAKNLTDWLPVEIIKSQNLLTLSQAIQNIHFPGKLEDMTQAKERLGFDELFLVQLQAEIAKQATEKNKATKIKFQETKTKEFVDSLPFKLTNAQKKSAWEILQNLENDQPMARLLQGDVGSGKTIVAFLALFNAALNKQQSVLMVPTEILAQQHYQSALKIFAKFNLKIGLITRGNKKINTSEKKLKPQEIIDEAQIIIGTHALIQEKINFKNLTLAIIDEQHRFGVEQRKTIREKSGNTKTSPHLLSMTATPIPRSLALALFGDLDLSIVNEMPASRKPVITRVVAETDRTKVYNFIRAQIKQGRQVFIICPLIDISDRLGVKSVKEEFDRLDKNIFPDLKIAMLHGRLKSAEKEKIMNDFLENKTNILVSTSVVEVGVDVPNATIMMIEGADRFGLAQLHQFRGRVGRGEHQSYCFLFSESDSPNTLNRLQAMSKYNDGFMLSKIDLKYRGPGEVYGLAQKGFPELKIASLFDYELIKKARTEVDKIIKKDPKLKNSPLLLEKLGEWNKQIHLE